MAGKILAGVVAALAAFGALWGALGWHLDPIHEELAFLREHVLGIERRLTTVERDVSSIVGYLRGQGGLPRLGVRVGAHGDCDRAWHRRDTETLTVNNQSAPPADIGGAPETEGGPGYGGPDGLTGRGQAEAGCGR